MTENVDVRTLAVRPEVAAFAQAMEEQLRANDHKGGWKDEPAGWLLERLWEELGELTYACLSQESSAEEAMRDGMDMIGNALCKYAAFSRVDPILHEAADVGNLAMMVADVAGALDTSPVTAALPHSVRDLLAHVAQMVHQGYHTDMPGTWRECPRDVCSSIRRELGEGG